MAVIIDENIKWKDITPGGTICCGGNANEFNTGNWRTDIPIFNVDKCRQCLLCIPVCPDSSISVKDGKRGEFDYKHCKGCGVCAKACPFDAIEMSKDIK